MPKLPEKGKNCAILLLRPKGGQKRGTKMYKPNKFQFKNTVAGYLDESVSWAETFDIVDTWTNYYQMKFWSAVQSARVPA